MTDFFQKDDRVGYEVSADTGIHLVRFYLAGQMARFVERYFSAAEARQIALALLQAAAEVESSEDVQRLHEAARTGDVAARLELLEAHVSRLVASPTQPEGEVMK